MRAGEGDGSWGEGPGARAPGDLGPVGAEATYGHLKAEQGRSPSLPGGEARRAEGDAAVPLRESPGAKREELRRRWRRRGGARRLEALARAIEHGAPATELREIVRGLELEDEVAPRLDLRGLELGRVVSFHGIDLSGARLDGLVLTGNIVRCTMVGAVLDGLVAPDALLDGDFRRASFRAAALRGACLSRARLDRADFTRAALDGARLVEASCVATIFREASLRGACFTGADLRRASFAEAVGGPEPSLQESRQL